jgi:hypothetical protein
MNAIKLKYQITLFGNYDEILPNNENIKYFLDNFSDKNLVPNQFKQINLDISIEASKANHTSRLSLTDSSKKWNIKFSSDRIDFIFTNSNIGVIEMPEKEFFLQEVIEFIRRINLKFPKTHKRVGFVTQTLFDEININSSMKKFVNPIDFYENKPTLEWSNRVATRVNTANGIDELLNVSSDFRWIKAELNIESKMSIFDGLVLNLDINTLNENSNYRFNEENLNLLFTEMLRIEKNILDNYIDKLN